MVLIKATCLLNVLNEKRRLSAVIVVMLCLP